MGVIKRGNKLYLRLKDAGGEWFTARTGLNVGQEAEAEKLLADAEREAARVRGGGIAPPSAALTVQGYFDRWIKNREAADLDWKNDRQRMRDYVLPTLGDVPIADLKTPHVVELFRQIRVTVRPGRTEPPAPHTVWNIHSTVSAFFRDAELDGVMEHAPKKLDERQLGPKRDKNPEWRAGAVFNHEEVETIISTPRIPLDRHVQYAIEFLTGSRTGECAALRWKNYDATMEPLGSLLIIESFNTDKGRAKGTKTDSVKYVPVHPTLAAILAEWKLSGWPAMFGRAPEPDDLIVPMPPDAAARRTKRKGEAFRSHDYTGRRWRIDDMPALGVRYRRHYDTRATFITLAVEDGADKSVIEEYVTHVKNSRSAFSGYLRTKEWKKVCGEVAKLNIVRRNIAASNVIPLPIAVNSGDHIGVAVTATVTAEESSTVSMSSGGDRRGSNPKTGHVGDSPSMESPRLTIVPGVTPRDAVSRPVTDDVTDPIADALTAARSSYIDERDPVKLRRALLRLLAELD